MLMGVSDRDDRDGAERDQHRDATDHHRHAGRDDAPEHDEQGEGRERQADELAALEVLLGDRLDVAVERRTTGEPDLQPGLGHDRGPERLERRPASGRGAGRA